MRDKELYRRILGIEAPWEVSEIELDIKAGEVRYMWSKSRGPSRDALNAGPIVPATTSGGGSGGIYLSAQDATDGGAAPGAVGGARRAQAPTSSASPRRAIRRHAAGTESPSCRRSAHRDSPAHRWQSRVGRRPPLRVAPAACLPDRKAARRSPHRQSVGPRYSATPSASQPWTSSASIIAGLPESVNPTIRSRIVAPSAFTHKMLICATTNG